MAADDEELPSARCVLCGDNIPFDLVEAHSTTCTKALSEADVEALAQAAFERAEALREIRLLSVDNAMLVIQSPAWEVGDAVAGMLTLTRFSLSFVPAAGSVEALSPHAASVLSLVLPGDLPLNLVERINRTKPWRGAHGLQIVTKEKRVFEFAFGRDPAIASRVYDVLEGTTFRGHDLVHAYAPHMIRTWTYDPVKEYARIGVGVGVGAGTPDEPYGELWRLSSVNAGYRVCPTYPALMAVPASVTDGLVADAAKFRSKRRLPALAWLHKGNGAAIVRCAQPLTGVTGRRSPDDEQLVNAIGATNPGGHVLHILDARPRANALGNSVKGAGYERVSNYDNVDLTYLGIDNIHAVRSAMNKLRELTAEPGSADAAAHSRWFSQLDSTRWFELQRVLLCGVVSLVDLVANQGHSAIVHCSDGWDRTALLVSLAELILDPYYRTLDGFAVLIEKEWCSFGYRFARRAGQGTADFDDDQRAPIFIQFMDCVWQIMNQAPRALEFNESLLLAIIDARYSARFGTFLYDCESLRVTNRVSETTSSLWAVVLDSPARDHYTNPHYKPSPSPLRIIPSLSRLRLWDSYYLRAHPHMRFTTLSHPPLVQRPDLVAAASSLASSASSSANPPPSSSASSSSSAAAAAAATDPAPLADP